MDWEPKSASGTSLLDAIFDPSQGWRFSPQHVPVSRHVGEDGSPYYSVNVDGTWMAVYEQTRWAEGVQRTVPANRLVVSTLFQNIVVKDPSALLRECLAHRGLPSYGLHSDGSLYLCSAIPIGSELPVDIARRQILACMGLVAEQAAQSLRNWNASPGPSSLDWTTVGKVAGVAGIFARALFDR